MTTSRRTPVPAILGALKIAGVSLALGADGALEFESDKPLSSDVVERIRKNKESLIALLRASSAAGGVGEAAGKVSAPVAGEPIPDELHEAISREERDLYLSIKKQIETGRLPAHLWAGVSGYLNRELPSQLFAALEELANSRDVLPSQLPENGKPSFPSRCSDCSKRFAPVCTRAELSTWGLANRHNCPEYVLAPPPPPTPGRYAALAPLVRRMELKHWAGGCARCSHFGPSHSNPLRSPGVCRIAKTVAEALPYPMDGKDCADFVLRQADEGKGGVR